MYHFKLRSRFYLGLVHLYLHKLGRTALNHCNFTILNQPLSRSSHDVQVFLSNETFSRFIELIL